MLMAKKVSACPDGLKNADFLFPICTLNQIISFENLFYAYSKSLNPTVCVLLTNNKRKGSFLEERLLNSELQKTVLYILTL